MLGSQTEASAQNAALSGTQQVPNAYARQIMETIEREKAILSIARTMCGIAARQQQSAAQGAVKV